MNNTFQYTNFAPPAAINANGQRIKNTNNILLWQEEDGKICYSRSYVSKDGTVSNPIVHTFPAHAGLNSIVEGIHWGCCGWSANAYSLTRLREQVIGFLDNL
jgi:hypothetical protein